MVEKLRCEEWITIEGKEHQVDLKPGDCELQYDIRADKEVSVYLSFGDRVIPIGKGYRVHGRFHVADIRWMLIKADKPCLLATSIFQRDRIVCDKLSSKPLAVFVPELPAVDLRSMVDRIVGEKLEQQMQPGETEIGLEEFFDDELSDGEEEFGPGFMEVDEAVVEAFEVRARERAEHGRKQEERKKEEEVGDPPVRRRQAPPRRKAQKQSTEDEDLVEEDAA